MSGRNDQNEIAADVAATTYVAATDSLTADAPAGGTGATAGAYDTAANRDLMIATVNGLNDTVASLIAAQVLLAADVAALRAAQVL